MSRSLHDTAHSLRMDEVQKQMGGFPGFLFPRIHIRVRTGFVCPFIQ